MNLFYNDGPIPVQIAKYQEKRKLFKGNNLKLLVLLDRRDLKFNPLDKICELLEIYREEKFNISNLVFAFNNDFKKKTFDKIELKNLVKLTEIFKELGVTVGIFDHEGVFNYHDVFNANKKIKEYANDIRKNNYSPLEKLMHAYFIAQERNYNEENEGKDSASISRSVYGVLNSDKVVCVGYSELLKSIIQEVDDPNVKVFPNDVGMIDIEKDTKDETLKKAEPIFGYHQNNLVYIKDEKYKIDGFYYLDPTWDNTYKPWEIFDSEESEDVNDKENESKTEENATEISEEIDESKLIPLYRMSHFLIEISQIKNVDSKNYIKDMYKTIIEHDKYRDSKEDSQKDINNFYKRVRKMKNASYTGNPSYASISSKEANFAYEGTNGNIFGDRYERFSREYKADETINRFLIKRKDYKDFLVLKQTEKFEKRFEEDIKNGKKDLDKEFEKNYKTSRNSPNDMSISKNGKAVWEYLNEHSPHITVDPLQSALNVVLKKMYPHFPKDYISFATNDILNANLEESKDRFTKDSSTPLTEISLSKQFTK